MLVRSNGASPAFDTLAELPLRRAIRYGAQPRAVKSWIQNRKQFYLAEDMRRKWYDEGLLCYVERNRYNSRRSVVELIRVLSIDSNDYMPE